MKKILPIFLLLISSISFSQNIEFEKKNFTDEAQAKEFREAKNSISKGNIFFNNQKYDVALEKYSSANKFNPENALLNFKIGICYYFTENDSLALVHFQKSKILKSDVNPEIDYYIGRTYHLNSKFDEAIVEYQKYLEQNKDEKNELISETTQLIKQCNAGKNIVKTNHLVENIGDSLNSALPELNAFFTKNDSSIIFIRYKKTEGEFIASVYFSNKKDSVWLGAEDIGKPINSNINDAIIGLSANGDSLYLYSDMNNGDIFYSTRTDSSKWEIPISFDSPINSNYAESSITFSNSNKTVFFISDRENSDKDIFVATKNGENWNNAKNLGKTVNSIHEEESVFIFNDTLFFASKGHNSIGGFDIFKTYKKNNKWVEPINLGVPINSPYDDFGYVQTDSNLYFISNRNGGFGEADIYIIKKIRPTAITQTIFVDTLFIDTLLPEIKYTIVSNILFDINKHENFDAYSNLNTLALFLIQFPDTKIQINGYTDTQGRTEYNQKLSEKRADFVAEYLISKNVNPKSIETNGLGEENQISINLNKNGKYIKESLGYNRRVEFKVVSETDFNKLQIKQIEVPEKFKIKD